MAGASAAYVAGCDGDEGGSLPLLLGLDAAPYGLATAAGALIVAELAAARRIVVPRRRVRGEASLAPRAEGARWHDVLDLLRAQRGRVPHLAGYIGVGGSDTGGRGRRVPHLEALAHAEVK